MKINHFFHSLTETTKPISGLFYEIEDYVYVALDICENPNDGLSQEESAAIHLYMTQFHDGPSLYLLLNQSLRAENREQLIPWFSFLRLFLIALHKLPSQSRTAWRSIKNVDLSQLFLNNTGLGDLEKAACFPTHHARHRSYHT
jgi:hypothetical protein